MRLFDAFWEDDRDVSGWLAESWEKRKKMKQWKNSRWVAEELESGDETQDEEAKSHFWADPLRPWEAKGNHHHHCHHHLHETQEHFEMIHTDFEMGYKSS